MNTFQSGDIFNHILWSSSISMSPLEQFSTEYKRIVDLQHLCKAHQSSPKPLTGGLTSAETTLLRELFSYT